MKPEKSIMGREADSGLVREGSWGGVDVGIVSHSWLEKNVTKKLLESWGAGMQVSNGVECSRRESGKVI